MSKYTEYLRKSSIIPQKRFGQNFLVDEGFLNKIINYANISSEDDIVEIGPGLGFLTELITNKSPDKIDCIEIDPDLCNLLRGNFLNFSFLHLHNVDAMRFDFASVLSEKTKIVANLPYNISVPLLMKLLKEYIFAPDMYVLVQKEVAQRICSLGGKKFGTVSVISNFLANTEILFDIPPEAFNPKPKVHSTFIKISPKNDYLEKKKLFHHIEKLCKILFMKKRKKLIKILNGNFKETYFLDILNDLNINPEIRPENLSIEQLADLAQHLNILKLI